MELAAEVPHLKTTLHAVTLIKLDVGLDGSGEGHEGFLEFSQEVGLVLYCSSSVGIV